MADIPQTPQTGTAPALKFKKGHATVTAGGETVNFNDDWARSLKPAKIKPTDAKDATAEERFVNEYEHHFPGLKDKERIDLLKQIYAACLTAE